MVIRHADLRRKLARSCHYLIQNYGQHLLKNETGGWQVVIELLGSIPLSLTDRRFQMEWNNGTTHVIGSLDPDASKIGSLHSDASTKADSNEERTTGDSFLSLFQWPEDTLSTAFASIKLVTEEFLETFCEDTTLVRSVLNALSFFSAQKSDINIALSSIEMMWKVSDFVVRLQTDLKYTGDAGGDDDNDGLIYDVMLQRLFQLSRDDRPEVRHCALNTLFATLVANTEKISSPRWQRYFKSILFPLFDMADARSTLAQR